MDPMPFRFIFWVVLVAAAAAVAALAIYYLTPWGWLSAEQIDKVQTVLFSAAVLNFAGSYLKRAL